MPFLRATAIGLAVFSYMTNGVVLFDGLSEPINKQMVYQPSTLGVTSAYSNEYIEQALAELVEEGYDVSATYTPIEVTLTEGGQ